MTLTTIDRATIPATRRGGSRSRLPADEQDMLRKLAGNGDCVSDGKTYPTAKAARIAAGPRRRFLRNLIKNGDATGKVHSRTWVDDSGRKTAYRWAVEVVND